MAMAWLWTGMVAVSLVFGILTGSVGELGGAALEGATAAVELCVSMAGIMCLWTGVMEVMEQCGLSAALARLFRPLLRRLLPEASRDPETLAAISANLSADLLGLGNAATPLGIRAARRMAQGCGGTASHELCLLVVLNSAADDRGWRARRARQRRSVRYPARRLDRLPALGPRRACRGEAVRADLEGVKECRFPSWSCRSCCASPPATHWGNG